MPRLVTIALLSCFVGGCLARGTCNAFGDPGCADYPRGHLGEMGGHMDPLPPPDEIDYVPSPMEFHERWVSQHRPVVMRGGCKHMPAYRKWTDEYLSNTHGDLMVTYEDRKVENRTLGGGGEMRLDKFLRTYKEDDLYLVIGLPQELAHDVVVPPMMQCLKSLAHLSEINMWFSSGGTRSVLHMDDNENILNIIDGQKKLILIPADEVHNTHCDDHKIHGTSPVEVRKVDLVRFPRFQKLKYHSVTLNAGDSLYIPHGWWHQVDSFNRNVACNFWWSLHSEPEGIKWGLYHGKEIAPKQSAVQDVYMEFFDAVGRGKNPCTDIDNEEFAAEAKLDKMFTLKDLRSLKLSVAAELVRQTYPWDDIPLESSSGEEDGDEDLAYRGLGKTFGFGLDERWSAEKEAEWVRRDQERTRMVLGL